MVKEQSSTYRITDWEKNDRPRERLAEIGARNLSSPELLAILLRVGVQGENVVQLAHRLLTRFGGLRGLHKASFQEVCDEHGMGPAKAAQIKAALELSSRLRNEDIEERHAIHSPQDAAELVLYEMQALPQEHLWVINLDTRNQLINIERVYVGSLNSSMVRIGELFRSAIQRNAAGIILVHNHPSGDPTPSPEDVALTRSVQQAGKLLDIDLLDHLVIGQARFVSLKDKAQSFNLW
jgi:DNA repair protein RadC